MKHIIMLLILTFLFNCKNNTHYQGYLYDGITKKPLSNVIIISQEDGYKSISNENGFF